MIERDPIGNDARDAEHLLELGPTPHICLFCGLSDPEWLIAKTANWLLARVPRTVLEQHHVVLEAHDPDFKVLLCILCHFKVSQGYLKAGITFTCEPDPRKRVALMLRNLALFREFEADALRKWARELEEIQKGERADGT
ncbi:MAG TPA: hypothetical protein VFA85_17110 [Terriglobales bacterium]|nr:hypothetical protein [Terriglobales bacterium]